MVSKLILALALALFGYSNAYAGFPSGSHNQQAVFNIVTLGVACNGVSDDQVAWNSAWATISADPKIAAGLPVTVIIPSGASCLFNGSCVPAPTLAAGNTLTIVATGATFTVTTGCPFIMGAAGMNAGANTGNNWRTNAVNVGDSCVTMTTSGSESNYFPGMWTIISGLGLQTTSFPSNFGVYEYKKVASIDTSAHRVCFTSPSKYAYKTNWPDWGTSCGPPCGGPPYLIGMSYPGFAASNCFGSSTFCKWDNVFTIIGGTWSFSAAPNMNGRTARLINVTCTSASTLNACWFPSQNQNVLWVNTTFTTTTIEADKEVENWNIVGGSYHGVTIQSSSLSNMTLTNGASFNLINGSPGLSLNCINSTIGTLTFGNNYGNTSDVMAFNGNACNITGGATGTNRPGCCTFSSGRIIPIWASNNPVWVLTAPSSGVLQCNENVDHQCHDALTFGGAEGYWVLNNQWNGIANGYPMQTTDITKIASGPNIFNVTTTLGVASLSSLPLDGGGNATYVPDFVRNWNCINCTGGPSMIDLSLPGAQGKPLFNYTKKTYTCQANVPNVANSVYSNNSNASAGITGLLPMVGKFVSATINVITPDTNSGGSLATVSVSPYGPISMTVNLKLTGSRTVTTSTTSGAQSGDTLSAYPANWFDQTGEGSTAIDQQPTLGPFNYDTLATNPALCAVWTIEVVTTR
jgi:hypothetical protein